MKTLRVASVIVLSLVIAIPATGPANAVTCSKANSAVDSAQTAYFGAMALVTSARAAVSNAQSQSKMARLPAQRAMAAVNLTRAQKSLASVLIGLTAAKVFLSQKKSDAKNCK